MTWLAFLTIAIVRLSTINLCVIILKPETYKSLLHQTVRYILGQQINKSLLGYRLKEQYQKLQPEKVQREQIIEICYQVDDIIGADSHLTPFYYLWNNHVHM